MGIPEALGLAAVLAVAAGTLSAGMSRSPRAGLTVQLVGMGLFGVLGVWVLASGHALGAGFHSGVRPAFGLDGLSGFFLLVVAVVGAPAALFARDSLAATGQGRALAAVTGVFLLVLVGFLSARDVSTFLGFWELMTLLPAAAILIARQDREARRGVFVYLAITHIGGAGVWVSMLVLAQHGALGGAPLGGGLAAFVACASLDRVFHQGGVDAVSLLAAARAPAGARAYLGIDVGRDDQARALRARARAVRLAGPARAVGGDRLAGAGCAVVCGWRAVCIDAARAQAAAGVSLDRERRDRRTGAGGIARVPGNRAAHVECHRVRCGAASRAQPRAVQGPLVPRRWGVQQGCGWFGARSAGGPFAADAVDRGDVRARRDGDRRAAAAERVRLGVVDAAVAAAPRGCRPSWGCFCRGARERGAGGDGGACGVLLREGHRARAARPAPPPGVRWRR